jgi:hypothetical protein
LLALLGAQLHLAFVDRQLVGHGMVLPARIV